MEFIIKAYMSMLDDCIELAERDSLEMSGMEFNEAQDAILRLKVHRSDANNILTIMSGGVS